MASAYPIRLSQLVAEADFKLKRSGEYRASAASLLAECQRRIGAGEPEAQGLSWPEYCRVHLSNCSPRDLRELMLPHAGGRQTAVDSERTFDRAWAAFLALDRQRQREFFRCGAALLNRLEETGCGIPPAPPNLINRVV